MENQQKKDSSYELEEIILTYSGKSKKSSDSLSDDFLSLPDFSSETSPKPLKAKAPISDPSDDIKIYSGKQAPPKKQPVLEDTYEPMPEHEHKSFFKKAIPYDIISKFEDDFTLGAKHAAKKIPKFSFLASLSFIFALTSFIISFSPAIISFNFPYITDFLTFIAPFNILILLVCQSISMLLGIEIIVSGIYRLVLFSPTIDTVIALNSIIILAHTVEAFLLNTTNKMPFSTVISIIMMLALHNKRQKLVIHKRNYTAAVLSSSPNAVKLTKGGKYYTATKTTFDAEAHCKKIAEPSIGESMSMIFVPLLVVLPLVLALIVARIQGGYVDFLWTYSGLCALSFPFGFLSISNKKEYQLSKKLFTSGTAFVDNSQLRKLNLVRSAVIKDSDVFPQTSVEVTGLKVVGNNSIEMVLAYATAMFEQISGGAYKAFADISKTRYVPVYHSENMHFYESGGISGVIKNDNVLLGNANFLMRMGVNVTHSSGSKNTIYMAINSTIAAVFTLSYSETSNTFKSFRLLKRVGIRPVLASLDFQVTPSRSEERRVG